MAKKKPKDPETRWVRVYGREARWGVRIELGMKMKDLPSDLAMTAVPHEGALHPLDYRSGSFVHLGYHPPKATVLSVGDYLVETPSGGVGFLRNSLNIKEY